MYVEDIRYMFVVPARKLIKLTPLELAIGEEMSKSQKRRREIEDMSFHRSAFNS
jgi:hypothetical protein